MEQHSVARLIGAPPGYVGYEEGGQLTEAARRRPYCVILLDEIEKAHRNVMNALLQLLDDGRLTDGQGRTVDFRNALVIMTSNLGTAHGGHDAPGAGGAASRERVMDAVREHLRPEVLNRIDEVVHFNPLGRGEIERIVEIQLARFNKLLLERQLELILTEGARRALAAAGFDPVYGARPLKRAIQRLVLDPLALRVLKGEFRAGDRIEVRSADGSTLDLVRAKLAAA
jgi:ATP-dependent Clp protease ATP-binding subunit ClpB